MRSLTTECVLV